MFGGMGIQIIEIVSMVVVIITLIVLSLSNILEDKDEE